MWTCRGICDAAQVYWDRKAGIPRLETSDSVWETFKQRAATEGLIAREVAVIPPGGPPPASPPQRAPECVAACGTVGGQCTAAQPLEGVRGSTCANGCSTGCAACGTVGGRCAAAQPLEGVRGTTCAAGCTTACADYGTVGGQCTAAQPLEGGRGSSCTTGCGTVHAAASEGRQKESEDASGRPLPSAVSPSGDVRPGIELASRNHVLIMAFSRCPESLQDLPGFPLGFGDS
jgi:hypothetical protein